MYLALKLCFLTYLLLATIDSVLSSSRICCCSVVSVRAGGSGSIGVQCSINSSKPYQADPSEISGQHQG
jgi:hypothetical protein